LNFFTFGDTLLLVFFDYNQKICGYLSQVSPLCFFFWSFGCSCCIPCMVC
jgi:hypothetical protein